MKNKSTKTLETENLKENKSTMTLEYENKSTKTLGIGKSLRL